jgi:hypothetical protein
MTVRPQLRIVAPAPAPISAIPLEGRVPPIAWDAPPPSGLLAAALAYWRSRRAGRSMPRRQDLDPLHIPGLLPFLMLVDVLREPLDFRYRLIGTELVQALATDDTGARFSSLAWQKRPSPVFGFAAAVAAAARPGWAVVPYISAGLTLHHAAALAMPLADQGGEVNMLLYAVQFRAPRLGVNDR